ncbi:MAG: hypothetical protein ACK4OO_00265 [bacterium]
MVRLRTLLPLKRTSLYALGLFTAIIGGLTGCDRQSRVAPQGDGDGSSTQLIPLQIGASWTYQTVITFDDFPIFDTLYTYLIDTSFTFDSKEWLGERGDSTFQRLGVEGIYQLEFRGGYAEESLLFKYPTTVGQRWAVKVGGSVGDGELVATQLTLTLPAGTFSSVLHYRLRFGDDQVNYYLNPGIGIVQTVIPWDNGSITSRLIRYNLRRS